VVEVPSRLVEQLIAATIVWVALENLAFPNGTRWRWLVAAVFVLVHGLGFASAPTELGQLAFVAVVMPIVVWLAKPGRFIVLPQALSVVVALAGAFWLVERLFFA